MAYKKTDLTQSQKKKLSETSSAGTPGQSGGKKKPEKKKYSALLTLLIICLIFGGSIFYLAQGFDTSKEVPISEFVQSYKTSKYSKVEVKDQTVIGTLAGQQEPSAPVGFDFANTAPLNTETSTLPAHDTLSDIGIDIDAPVNSSIKIIDTTSMHFWADLAPTIIGTVLFIGIFILLMGKMM